MATPKLAVLETYLKDIIVSEETITRSVEMRDHIFEIKDADKSLGFISLYDLKAYVYEHDIEAQNYWVKNIDNNEWKNIYDHPFFQRRKPQLVSTDTLKNVDDLEFYILQKGQKTGPFEKYELMDKVEKKEILLSDMVSFNAGYTWIKLFQVDGFDRRSLKDNDQLPGMPTNEFLNRPSDSISSSGDSTDAITSLAFLGNQKKGKTIERDREMIFKDEMEKGVRSISIYKYAFVISVIGIVYVIFNIKSNLDSPFIPKNQTTGEQVEMLKPVEMPNNQNTNNFNNNQINDQRRTSKYEIRRLNPIRPAARKSFMDTRKFKESTNDSGSQNSAEDNNYYYENPTPMELDPVRSQISKENFDNGGNNDSDSPRVQNNKDNFENGGEVTPAPEGEALFNNEVSN
jgi:hypothetical protein